MRTTLTIEDGIARDLKKIADETDSSFKEVVNEVLRAGLQHRKAPRKRRRYRLEPASLGNALPGVDLDKALALAEAIEDQEIGRKLERRR